MENGLHCVKSGSPGTGAGAGANAGSGAGAVVDEPGSLRGPTEITTAPSGSTMPGLNSPSMGRPSEGDDHSGDGAEGTDTLTPCGGTTVPNESGTELYDTE